MLVKVTHTNAYVRHPAVNLPSLGFVKKCCNVI